MDKKFDNKKITYQQISGLQQRLQENKYRLSSLMFSILVSYTINLNTTKNNHEFYYVLKHLNNLCPQPMIDIKKLKETDKGRKVIYIPQSRSIVKPEEGVISSWNKNYVFVKYGSDTTSKATSPENLKFLTDS